MRRAAQALLLIVFGVCVYRAFTQSLVYDEALTNELYVLGPLNNVLHSYTANHHFLNSILMRISAGIFGDSEGALRLPALGAAVLYFIAIYRLALTAFGESIFCLLAVALLSLNPFVLDFMVAARGYGMALALMMFALALLMETFKSKPFSLKKLAWAGACLALSITANLIFIFPATALAALVLMSLRIRRRAEPDAEPSKGNRRREARKKPKTAEPAYSIWFLAPMGIVSVLFIVAAPIDAIRLEDLYTGASTISGSLRSMATVALLHSGPLRQIDAMKRIRDVSAFFVAPAIVLAAFAIGIVYRQRLLLWTSAPLVFASAALMASHFLFGRPYPEDRTGFYFAPLASVALVALAFWAKDVSKFAAATLGGLTLVLIVCFLTEFNVRKFWVWEYDADTRSIGDYIASHRDPTADTVKVGGSWQLAESMYYYLLRNRWEWMEIERRAPEPGYSFYTLLPQDQAVMDKLNLKAAYVGPVSGTILAIPKGQ